MKQLVISITLVLSSLLLGGCHSSNDTPANALAPDSVATVYLIRDITPQSLVSIYQALGVEPTGRVAVKISTGAS